MSVYPGATPPNGTAVPSDTLAVAGHTALHNTSYDEIGALAIKMGTGASTPTSGTFLRGNGIGASAWAQVSLSGADVTGVLPVGSGGLGQNTLTGLPLLNPAITGTVTGGATYSSPTLTTPTIADFTNATHTHANAAGGGQLNGANAITDGTITPAELTSGTGSSWAWQSWTPSYTNFTVGNAVVVGKYTQIGKTVHFRLSIVLGSTSAMGSAPTFTLPVTSVSYSGTAQTQIIGQAGLLDAGVLFYTGFAMWNSTTTALIQAGSHGATYQNTSNLTSSVPWTWKSTDEISIQGTYEAT